MQKDGTIQGFTVRTRPDMDARRVRAIMCIAIEGERSAKVTRALRGFAEVDQIHTTNGRWDLVVELDTETLADFSRTLDQVPHDRRDRGHGDIAATGNTQGLRVCNQKENDSGVGSEYRIHRGAACVCLHVSNTIHYSPTTRLTRVPA